MIQTIDTLVRITSNILWTGVALYLLIYLREQLKSVLNRIASAKTGEFSLGKEGLSFKFEDVVETAVNLGAAAAVQKGAKPDLHQIARSITEAAKTGAISQLGGRRVMWVDDEPHNNEYGIKSLQSQGVEVVISKSTSEALKQAEKQNFDAIITDQLRYEDGVKNEKAGYDLIRSLRDNGVRSPVILSSAFPDESEARSLGFFGATNTQHGVFELVLQAIQGAQRSVA